MATVHNIQYNIPRVQVQLPGRQNRLTDGEFRISPSMTEPVVFVFGNQDGLPLNLNSFRIQFVVWEYCSLDTKPMALGQSKVLINKKLLFDDPYAGQIEMVLTEDETQLLGNHAAGNTLHWSLFLINTEEQIFPMQVSSHGGRYGTLLFDFAGAMPIAEIIRNPTS